MHYWDKLDQAEINLRKTWWFFLVMVMEATKFLPVKIVLTNASFPTKGQLLSCVRLFETPQTTAHQASSTPGVYSNSCPLSRWYHPTISSSVIPFSSCLQFFSASGSFPMSQFFPSDGQSIGVSASASVLPMNIQDWFPLGWTSWNSLQSKGLSRVFSNTTVQKHEFFSTQLSL